MIRELRRAAVAFLIMTLLTGVLYPFAVWGVAQTLFPVAANGSALPGGRGSALIGQSFSGSKYFWPRPSATSPSPYVATAAGATNLGPSNPALADLVRARVAEVRAANPGSTGPVPADLVTTSGSGLDPHISPEAAEFQVARVALARRLSPGAVRALVEQCTDLPTLGLLGAPRVNVVRLNLALDGGEPIGGQP